MRQALDGSKKMIREKFSNRGFGIIEILVVIFIVTVVLASLMQLYNLFLKSERHSGKYIQATLLAQEALEATRNVRDAGWANISGLTTGAQYHPVQSGSPISWNMSAGEETINGLTRQVVLEQVYRDANDNIVESGGTEDVGSRKVITTVSWNDAGQNQSISIFTYLMNWRQ